MRRVAVIGAGLSGLVAARELGNHCEVTVFEKSRGYGGRMATRHAEDFEFDHGAQFFLARSSEFQTFLEPLISSGVIACWNAEFAELHRQTVFRTVRWDGAYPHYVGAPRMNAIGKYLADGLAIRQNTAVAELQREASVWNLNDSDGNALGQFDWVICAVPAAQAAALAPATSTLHRLAGAVDMLACYALMLGFDTPLSLPWQAALVHDADISWISVNSSKPRRAERFALLVHSTNRYANANLESDLSAVQDHLLTEVSEVAAIDGGQASFSKLHRWRYANVEKQSGPDCHIDTDLQLAACGDWFRHGRVEAAFLSGWGVAEELLARLR